MKMEQTMKNREVTEMENHRKAIMDMTIGIHDKKTLRKYIVWYYIYINVKVKKNL